MQKKAESSNKNKTKHKTKCIEENVTSMQKHLLRYRTRKENTYSQKHTPHVAASMLSYTVSLSMVPFGNLVIA